MSRGGPRPGSGRPRGPAKRTKEKAALADMAAAAGITPVEVMLANMRFYWAQGDRKAAEESALNAAPFIHPKLSSIDGRIDNRVTISEMSESELHRIAGNGSAGAAAAEERKDEPHQIH